VSDTPPPDATQVDRPPRRAALWWMLGGLGVLLVVVIVLLVVLLLRPSGAAPIAADTPTPTPTPSASHTPTPTPSPSATTGGSGGGGSNGGGSNGSGGGGSTTAAPVIQSFTASPNTVACADGGPGFPAQLNFDITISWSTKDAARVAVGVDTGDPIANPFSTGLSAQGSTTVPFSCYGPHTYSVAAVGADGHTVTKTIQVVNTGDPDPNG
jgi:hypothetical protein